MKKIMFFPLLIMGVFILSGCSSYGGTSTNSSAAMPVATQGIAIASNAIAIQNFAFSPTTLTVKKGTAVIWTNNDSAAHQIKSAAFNSNLLSKGQSFSFTFNDIGTFDYSCAIHSSMTGKIIVE